MKSLIAWLIIAVFTLAVLVVAPAVLAKEENAAEVALVACLNGKPIQVGDAYFTCSEMRIPGAKK